MDVVADPEGPPLWLAMTPIEYIPLLAPAGAATCSWVEAEAPAATGKARPESSAAVHPAGTLVCRVKLAVPQSLLFGLVTVAVYVACPPAGIH
jgi:hypothetical protein